MSYGEEERREKLRELGARVRAKREELGMSLEQVSDKTKMRSKYLIAVEEGNDSTAPGQTYFRAFLKTYASFLGLDGSEFSQRYREILEEAAAPKPPMRPGQKLPQKPGTPTKPPLEPKASTDAVTAAPGAPSSGGTDPGASADTVGSSTPGTSQLTPTAPLAGSIPPPVGMPKTSEQSDALGYRRPTRTDAHRRRMPGERRRKGNSAVWVFLALAAVAAVVFFVAINRPATPVEPGGTGVTPTGGAPSGGDPAGGVPAGGVTPTDPLPPAPKVTREDPTKETTIWSVDRSPVELVLKLTGERDSYCWVNVHTDGEFAFERTLTPNEEIKISAKSKITIRAGKPWVIHVQVNGQDMGLAGEFGPVKDLIFQSTTTTN